MFTYACFALAGGAVEDLPELPVPQKSKKYLPPKPPVITEPPKSALVEKSTPFRLYCRAEGNPTPTISWYKDGSPLATAVGMISQKKKSAFPNELIDI